MADYGTCEFPGCNRTAEYAEYRAEDQIDAKPDDPVIIHTWCASHGPMTRTEPNASLHND